MMPDRLFSMLNPIATAGWILLIVAPRGRWTTRVAGAVVPVTLAATYLALVAATWFGSEGGFSTLAGVTTLFSNRWILLAGWTHYLVFDLLVGGWETRDAAARQIPHVWIVPSLILTFLFGPIGWLS
jgi:hypothetical protein